MNMDINRIFNLFNSGGDDFESHRDEEFEGEIEFEEFKTTPMYKIGMFEKMILNHNNISTSVSNLFKKSNEEFNLLEVEEAGEYINECDLKDECWREGLLFRDSEYITTAVKLAIHYFESYEEYEKCALLKSIQLFLEDNLDSKS